MEKARKVIERNRSSTGGVYVPRGASKELFDATEPEIMISGPAGTGKSRGVLEYLHHLALKNGKFRAIIVRKTRASLNETGLVTYEEKVLGATNPMVTDGPTRRGRQFYRYPNGAVIAVGGMDSPGKVLSSEWDIIYVQQAEEVSLSDWETLTTRLRNWSMPVQQIVGDCNPDSEMHWIMGRQASGTLRVLESRHEDNPILWDEEKEEWTPTGVQYLAILDKLTGVRKERLRYGRWVSAEGAVYEGYSRALHWIDRRPIPDDWQRFRVVDFGYTNPFVCQWWAEDPDGRLYMYREIYETQKTVKVHAQRILELSKGERIFDTVCDHDAEDRATLEENGISTTPADKRVRVGIDEVTERLKVAGDGRPRLFLMRDSLVEVDRDLEMRKLPTQTEMEFGSYVWGKTKKDDPKEEPVKEHDHGMDALRYAVMFRKTAFGFADIGELDEYQNMWDMADGYMVTTTLKPPDLAR